MLIFFYALVNLGTVEIGPFFAPNPYRVPPNTALTRPSSPFR